MRNHRNLFVLVMAFAAASLAVPATADADCAGKQCGSDGKGGTCGTCHTDMVCNAYQKCACEIEAVSNHGQFYDVKASSELDKILDKLYGKKIVAGCQDNPLMFCPDCPMVRWQAALFVGRALGLKAGTTCTNPFPDVNLSTVTASTCNMIAQLKARGVMNGYSDDAFGPNDITTREQAATILANAFFDPEDYAGRDATFSDVKSGRWSFAFVETAYHECIMEGTSSTKFSPTQSVYRKEFVKWLARAVNSFPKFPGCEDGGGGGCQKNTDCAGDKVCVSGDCVDCTGSSSVCSGYSVKKCVNNQWSYTTCGSGMCEDGECVECIDGSKSCLGNQIKQCVNNTMKYTHCGSGMTCYGGVCVSDAECSDAEAPVCVGDKVRRCMGGKYYDNTCSSGLCEDGQCVSCKTGVTPDTCVASTMVKSCVNNAFTYRSCPSGQTCENGTCVTKEIIKDCEYGVDPYATCEGNQQRFCNPSGMYSFTSCTGSMTCENGKCVTCNNSMKPECTLDQFGHVSIKKCVNNQIVYESCGVNALCHDGVCVAQTVPDCLDDDFTPVCEGNAIKSCVNEQFTYTSCAGACENGQCVACANSEAPVCVGNAVKSCVNNAYVETPCGSDQMCILGVCEDIPECEQDYPPVCADEQSVKSCGENGKFKVTPCKPGYVCQSGQCEYLKECTPGTAADCVGEQLRTCSSNHKYILSYCTGSLVCDDGKCVTCRDDFAPTCDVDGWGNPRAKVCQNNSFSYVNCQPGEICKDGVGCVNPDVPDCDAATFVPDCTDDKTMRTCGNDGKYVFTACANGESCSEGTCKKVTLCDETFINDCQGNSVRACAVSGVFSLSPCLDTETCVNGACKVLEGAPECRFGELTSCVDNSVRACNEAGKYTMTPCLNGEVCKDGACTLVCEPGTAPDCSGNSIRSCTAGGKYMLTECVGNLVCDAGKCVTCRNDEPVTCAADAWGNVSAKKCVNNNYTLEYCMAPKVCQEGVGCAEPFVPECDVNSHQPTCVGDSIQTCSDEGKFVLTPCGDGMTCTDGQCHAPGEAPVECDAATYVAECINGQVRSCSAEGRYVMTSCGSQVCRDGACVTYIEPECDPATFVTDCMGSSVRSCGEDQRYVYQSCENGVCVNGACQTHDSDHNSGNHDDEGNHDGSNDSENNNNHDGNEDNPDHLVDSDCAMNSRRPAHGAMIPVLLALLGCLGLRRRGSRRA